MNKLRVLSAILSRVRKCCSKAKAARWERVVWKTGRHAEILIKFWLKRFFIIENIYLLGWY